MRARLLSKSSSRRLMTLGFPASRTKSSGSGSEQTSGDSRFRPVWFEPRQARIVLPPCEPAAPKFHTASDMKVMTTVALLVFIQPSSCSSSCHQVLFRATMTRLNLKPVAGTSYGKRTPFVEFSEEDEDSLFQVVKTRLRVWGLGLFGLPHGLPEGQLHWLGMMSDAIGTLLTKVKPKSQAHIREQPQHH